MPPNQDTNTQPTTDTSQGSLDPSVVNLARSIRQVESGGNFESVGDNGTSSGAFQWQQPTWQGMSQKYLGADAPATPLQATPEQQNEVAYKQLADWKSQGYSQAQSASMWNSGDPNAYQTQTPGFNSQVGVSYNTPQYVQDVENVYGQVKNGEITNQPQNTPLGKPQTSKTPNVDLALGLGGIGAGLLGLDLVAPEVGIPIEAAEATGGAGILGNIISVAKNLASKAAPYIEGAGTLATVKGLMGGSQSQTQPNYSSQLTDLNNSLPQSQEASKTIKNNLSSFLGQTQGGTVALQDPKTQNGLDTIASYGALTPNETGIDENGRMDTSSYLENADKMIGDISEHLAKVSDTEDKYVDLDSVSGTAKEEYRKFNPNATPSELASADSNIDNEINSYKKAYGKVIGNKKGVKVHGGKIKLGDAERARKQQGHASGKWDATNTTKKGSHKSLYSALRSHNLNSTEYKELYQEALKKQSDLFDAKKVLKKLNGKKPTTDKKFTESALRSLGRYGAIAIGDKIGGPLGAILGGLVGEKVSRTLDKRFGKNLFEKKGMRQAIKEVEKRNPEIAFKLKSELKKYGIKSEEVKKTKSNRKSVPK